MKLPGWLCLGGTEIINEVRTRAYVRAGLVDSRWSASASEDCDCSPLDDEGPYISPAADPAPWYDVGNPASESFFGLFSERTELGPVISRQMTPRVDLGGILGSEFLGPRVIEVIGWMAARDEAGMRWGERWLTEVLRGRICRPGCAPDELDVLIACADSTYFRRLVGSGLIDGPRYVPLGSAPECIIQEVQFQLQAEMPYLYRDPISEVNQIAVPASSQDCALVDVAEWFDGSTLRMQVEANAGNATDLTLSMTVSLDGTCPEERIAACAVWEIPSLPEAGVLVIDGRNRTVTFANPTTHRDEAGFRLIEWSGAFPWPDLAPCAQMCVCLENGGTEEVTWTNDQYPREL